MKKTILATLGVAMLASTVMPISAHAAGTVKGAAAGAVVGSVAGHHAKTGALVGAAAGHHHAASKATVHKK